jgi:hypothetical protein
VADSWFDGNGNGGAVDVAGLLDGLGSQGLRELVEAGALVSVGTTRDGGALALTVTVDGTWRRDYFRQQDEMLLWIAEALPAVEQLRGTSRPAAAPRERARPSRKR